MKDELLTILTLGTARQQPSREVRAYLELRDATDPTADAAEITLAAWAIQERLARLQVATTEDVPTAAPVEETRPLPSPKLGRALTLLFNETYAPVLPQAVAVLHERGLRFPPALLPGLLDYAATQLDVAPELATTTMVTAGTRGGWLARQHPDWLPLAGEVDHATNFRAATGPAEKRKHLERWRREDPAAARRALADTWKAQKPTAQEHLLSALTINLGEEDIPWLKDSLTPKRKGVRRALLELLLLAGDQETTDRLTELAVTNLTAKGRFVNIVGDEASKATLVRYGGLKKQETISEYLHRYLPPNIIPDLTGQPLADYWAGLAKKDLKAAAEAIYRFRGRTPYATESFLAYTLIAPRDKLPLPQIGKIVAALPRATFETVVHGFMDSERHGLESGGVAMLLLLARNEPWSERITKAYVLALVARVRDIHKLPYSALRQQAELWKQATPLLHVDTFPFLRQQLHGMTERPDQFGQLALSMLQTTSFRKLLHQA